MTEWLTHSKWTDSLYISCLNRQFLDFKKVINTTPVILIQSSTQSENFVELNQNMNQSLFIFSSVQFSSAAQSCPTLRPHESQHARLPVHHHFLEFTQTHVHRVCDAIQPSHPLSSSSPPAPNPSYHQGLFQRVNSSHEVAKVLKFQFQHQSYHWTPRTDLL